MRVSALLSWLLPLFGRRPKPAVKGPCPDIWLGPAPGIPLPMLLDPTTIEELRSLNVSTIQFYQQQTMEVVPIIAEPNTRSSTETVAGRLREAGFATAIEVSSLKEWNKNDDSAMPTALSALDSASVVGAKLIISDEAFAAGKWIGMSQFEALRRIEDFSAATGAILVEPFPSLSADEIMRAAYAMYRGLKNFDGEHVKCFVHLDIDLHAIHNEDAAKRQLREIVDRCGIDKIEVGIVIWGCDERSDAHWMKSANDLVAFLRETFKSSPWPTRLIIQSWSPDVQAPRRRPSLASLIDLTRTVRALFA